MSQSDFSKTSQIIAVPNDLSAEVEVWRVTYGALLPVRTGDPSSPEVLTILGFQDRDDSDDLRAGILGETVTGQMLSDDRFAFQGCFSLALLFALPVDPDLSQCEILTMQQLKALTVS